MINDLHGETSNSSMLDQSILVVDDDEVLCRYCTRVLQNMGYTARCTPSSLAALNFIRQQPYDLLLTDIKMPQMTGLELARQAREIQPDLAVVIMTGETTLDLLLEVVQQGVTSYLSKPFELKALQLTVSQVLHQRKTVLENAQLQTIAHQLELSRTFNSTLALSELCRHIMYAAHNEIKCRLGYFLLFSANESSLINGSSDQPQVPKEGWKVMQDVYHDGELRFAELSIADRRFSVVCFPLNVSGLNIGSALFDYTQPLSAPNINSMTLMLSQAAAALNNAQLFTRIQVANARLQELDHLKSEFIAITSHELRTPLSVVMGYAMLLHERNESQQREYMRRLIDSAQRIKDIVDDMTHLRHLDRQQNVLHVEPVDLGQLVTRCIDDMSDLSAKKKQVIKLTHDQADIPVVYLDPEKIALVVLSLLSNAIKFTPAEGSIKVQVWYAMVDEVPYRHSLFEGVLTPGDWAFVSVTDSGIGIHQAQHQRIFERFYQVASSLTREHGGTGLGLALVRELVEAHKGEVRVKSSEGVGSTFTIALPQRELMVHSA